MAAAKRAQAIAFRRHRRSLLNQLQSGSNDRLWWNLTKNISGLCKSRGRFAPDVDDLASYFVEKLSLSADFDPGSSTVSSELFEVSYKKSW